jgi:hypothetical protein
MIVKKELMKLAEKQPKPKREPKQTLWCKFWCNSLAHVIHNSGD